MYPAANFDPAFALESAPLKAGQFKSAGYIYVHSALQAEQGFGAGQSQSVYARAKAKLNNNGHYQRRWVARAEAVLDSPTGSCASERQHLR